MGADGLRSLLANTEAQEAPTPQGGGLRSLLAIAESNGGSLPTQPQFANPGVVPGQVANPPGTMVGRMVGDFGRSAVDASMAMIQGQGQFLPEAVRYVGEGAAGIVANIPGMTSRPDVMESGTPAAMIYDATQGVANAIAGQTAQWVAAMSNARAFGQQMPGGQVGPLALSPQAQAGMQAMQGPEGTLLPNTPEGMAAFLGQQAPVLGVGLATGGAGAGAAATMGAVGLAAGSQTMEQKVTQNLASGMNLQAALANAAESATASGALETATGRLPLDEILRVGKGASRTVGQVASQTVRGGAAEAAQEGVTQAGQQVEEYLRTGDPAALQGIGRQTLQAMAAGGLLGGASAAGGGGVGMARNALGNRGGPQAPQVPAPPAPNVGGGGVNTDETDNADAEPTIETYDDFANSMAALVDGLEAKGRTDAADVVREQAAAVLAQVKPPAPQVDTVAAETASVTPSVMPSQSVSQEAAIGLASGQPSSNPLQLEGGTDEGQAGQAVGLQSGTGQGDLGSTEDTQTPSTPVAVDEGQGDVQAPALGATRGEAAMAQPLGPTPDVQSGQGAVGPSTTSTGRSADLGDDGRSIAAASTPPAGTEMRGLPASESERVSPNVPKAADVPDGRVAASQPDPVALDLDRIAQSVGGKVSRVAAASKGEKAIERRMKDFATDVVYVDDESGKFDGVAVVRNGRRTVFIRGGMEKGADTPEKKQAAQQHLAGVALHEYGHVMRRENPDLHKELVEAVGANRIEDAGEKYREKLAAQWGEDSAEVRRLDEDADVFEDEAVGQLLQDFASKDLDIAELVMSRPGLMAKLKQWLRKVTNKMRSGEAGARDAKLADAIVDVLSKAEKRAEENRATRSKPSVVSSPPAIAETRAVADGSIENFGEQLPSRFKAPVASSLTEADFINKPLSEAWPSKSIESIADNDVAAAVKVFRDAVGTKPKASYKVKSWAKKAVSMRNLADGMMRGEGTSIDELKKMSLWVDHASRIEVLRAIDRTQWNRIGEVSTHTKGIIVHIDDKDRFINGSDKVSEHIDAIRSMLGTPRAAKRMDFEVRQSTKDGKFFINKSGDSQHRKLMQFDTSQEAFEAKRNKYEQLVEAWDGLKKTDSITERDLRTDTNRPRSGQDWRKGRDVDPQEFQRVFGFRGGEFGKWVSQGKGAAERQFFLNNAYDALMDLADIVGVPPRAISLEGTLGIAFGSRGSGWGSAHYESDTLVINLTKPRGAGALAHEWFHALDNYFARKRGAKALSSLSDRDERFITHKTEQMMVQKADTTGRFPISRERLADLRKRNPNSSQYAEERWMPDPRHPEGVRVEVEAAFENLVKVLNASDMTKRAIKLDGRKSIGGYWSRTLERAARAFESYVIKAMNADEYHNDFLVNVRKADEVAKSGDRYPYMTDAEMPPVKEAFDRLFEIIQVKPTEDGKNFVMFAPRDKGVGSSAIPGSGRAANAIAGIMDKAKAATNVARLERAMGRKVQAQAKREAEQAAKGAAKDIAALQTAAASEVARVGRRGVTAAKQARNATEKLSAARDELREVGKILRAEMGRNERLGKAAVDEVARMGKNAMKDSARAKATDAAREELRQVTKILRDEMRGRVDNAKKLEAFKDEVEQEKAQIADKQTLDAANEAMRLIADATQIRQDKKTGEWSVDDLAVVDPSVKAEVVQLYTEAQKLREDITMLRQPVKAQPSASSLAGGVRLAAQPATDPAAIKAKNEAIVRRQQRFIEVVSSLSEIVLPVTEKDRSRQAREIRARMYSIAKQLPAEIRGELLKPMRDAKDTESLLRAWVRADEVMGDYEMKRADKALRIASSRDSMSKMGQRWRDQLTPMIEQAKLMREGLKTMPSVVRSQATAGKLVAGAGGMNAPSAAVDNAATSKAREARRKAQRAYTDLVTEIGGIQLAARVERMVLRAKPKLDGEKMAQEIATRVRAHKFQRATEIIKLGGKTVDTGKMKAPSVFAKAAMWEMSPRTIFVMLDGDSTGPAHDIMGQIDQGKKDRYVAVEAAMKAANSVVQQHGFESWEDFADSIAGRAGEANVERVELRLSDNRGGQKDVSLRTGQALKLYALSKDGDASKRLEAGVRFTLEEGGTQYEWSNKLSAQLETQLGDDVIAIYNKLQPIKDVLFPDAQNVGFMLTGRLAPKVANQTGITIDPKHRKGEPDGTLPQVGGKASVLEGAGLLKERTNNASPILLTDYVNDWQSSVREMATIAHLGLPLNMAQRALIGGPGAVAITRGLDAKVIDHLHAFMVSTAELDPKPDGMAAKVQALNNAVARSRTTRASTVLMNFGSIFRTMGEVPAYAWAKGFGKDMFTNAGFDEVLLASPIIRERFTQNYATLMTGQASGVAANAGRDAMRPPWVDWKQVRTGLKQTKNSLKAMRGGEALGNLRTILDANRTQMWAESIGISHLYRAKLAEAKMLGKPDPQVWAIKQVEDKFANVMGSHDAANLSRIRMSGKTNALALLMNYTSEPSSMFQQLSQAYMLRDKPGGRQRLARVLAGFAANAVWSAAVKYSFKYGWAAGLVALGLSDDDDQEKKAKQIREEAFITAATSVLPGFALGSMGQAIADMKRGFGGQSLTDSSVGSQGADAMLAIGNIVKRITSDEYVSKKADSVAEQILIDFLRTGESVVPFAGVPSYLLGDPRKAIEAWEPR